MTSQGGTKIVPDQPDTIAALLLLRARTDPGADAVAGADLRFLTYHDLTARSAAIHARLMSRLEPSTGRVGIYGDNSPFWLMASLAVWAAGRSVAAVGTSLMPSEAVSRFHAVGAQLVLTAAAEPELEAAGLDCLQDCTASRTGPPDAWTQVVTVRGADEACVFFTSGTTSAPKGIPYTHADLMQSTMQTVRSYSREPGFRTPARPERPPSILFNPFGHHGIYPAVATRVWLGRRVVLVPKFSVDQLREVLRSSEVETLQLTPAAIFALAYDPDPPDLSTLRYVTSGSAALSADVKRRFEQRFGVPVLSTYGMSEVGAICQLRPGDIGSQAHARGSVGRVAPGVAIRFLNAEGREVAPGEEGEIVVRPALSERRYIGDARIEITDGWLHTGDIGRQDSDGYVFITGRRGEKMIVGGFNVYPSEVENAILASGLVRDAVVAAVPDERLGEIPVAGIRWAGAANMIALRETLRRTLAHYKIPRRWAEIDDVPRNALGKIDRRAAAAWAEQAFGPAEGGEHAPG